MQVTSPYWFQPEFNPVLRDKPIAGHLGFKTNIPWPAPVTVGSMYFGEGALPDRRTVETSPFGEYFAVNNTVPTTGGGRTIRHYRSDFHTFPGAFCISNIVKEHGRV